MHSRKLFANKPTTLMMLMTTIRDSALNTCAYNEKLFQHTYIYTPTFIHIILPTGQLNTFTQIRVRAWHRLGHWQVSLRSRRQLHSGVCGERECFWITSAGEYIRGIKKCKKSKRWKNCEAKSLPKNRKKFNSLRSNWCTNFSMYICKLVCESRLSTNFNCSNNKIQ